MPGRCRAAPSSKGLWRSAGSYERFVLVIRVLCFLKGGVRVARDRPAHPQPCGLYPKLRCSHNHFTPAPEGDVSFLGGTGQKCPYQLWVHRTRVRQVPAALKRQVRMTSMRSTNGANGEFASLRISGSGLSEPPCASRAPPRQSADSPRHCMRWRDRRVSLTRSLQSFSVTLP